MWPESIWRPPSTSGRCCARRCGRSCWRGTADRLTSAASWIWAGPNGLAHSPNRRITCFTKARPARWVTCPPANSGISCNELPSPSCCEIFGRDLLPRSSHSYAVNVGRGVASLGCFVPPSHARLLLQRRDASSRGRIRLEFQSGAHHFELSVTDIRLYGDDHVTPDAEAVERIAQRLQDGPDLILGVGLTRAFQGTPAEPALHWLQVNNLHFADDPCWRLA